MQELSRCARPTPPDRPAALPALTSLRFFAALGVVLFHLDYLKNSARLGGVYRAVFSQGFIGVSFFFTLSGFVLAYNYRDRFRTLDAAGLRAYVVSRFARIYPLHLFALLCFLTIPGLALGSPPRGVRQFLAAATLTQAYVPNPAYQRAFNGPSASLSIEVLFYAVFPFAVFGVSRWVRGPAGFAAVGVAVWAVQVAWMRLLLPSSWATAHQATLVWLYNMFPPARLFEFLVGVAAGLAFIPPRTGHARHAWWTAAESAAVALAVACIFFRTQMVEQLRATTGHTIFFDSAVLCPPAFCVLLLVFAAGRGRLSTWLASRPMILLGESSYALFLLHATVLWHLVSLSGRFPAVAPLGGRLGLATIVLSVAVATLAHRGIEVPMRRLIVKRWGAAPAQADASLRQAA